MRWALLVLVGLLVATNIAWFAASRGTAPTPARTAPDIVDEQPPRERELEARVRSLERDLAAARRDAADALASASNQPPRPATGAGSERVRPSPAAPVPPPRPAAPPFDARAAAKQTETWLSELRSLEDPAAKAGALQAIRAALAGDDPTALQAALRALAQAADVEYDRTGLRHAILRVLDEGPEFAAGPAFYALYNTDRQDGDIDRVVRVVDAGYRGHGAVHLLSLFGERDLTGDAGRAALVVLDDLEEQGKLGEQVSGIWGARVSPGIEQKMLSLASSGETRRMAIYFGLSTQANKSREVVDVLLEAAAGTDPSNRSRSFWGLGHGVSEDDYAHLARGLGRIAEQRRDPQTLRSIRDILRRYPSPEADEVLGSLE